MGSSEFIDLLAKYRMTFYWGAIDKKWWIIGQVEGGTAQNSRPAHAESFNTAQVAALTYIQKKYKLGPQTIDPAKSKFNRLPIL